MLENRGNSSRTDKDFNNDVITLDVRSIMEQLGMDIGNKNIIESIINSENNGRVGSTAIGTPPLPSSSHK